MKEATTAYYNEKVEKLLLYIQANLSSDLSIKKLADYSAISHFHFHRIVKAVLGEPLGVFIDRTRLDTAVKLIRYSDSRLQEIAESIGYNDLSAFSKAFIKEFGISPQEYRNNKDLILNTHVDCVAGPPRGKVILDIRPKVISLRGKRVVYIRVKGEYGGNEVLAAWEELSTFAMRHKLLGWNPDVFSVYYDDPDIIGRENCLSDLCVATKKTVPSDEHISVQVIPPGMYLMVRYKGPYECLWEVYDTIYKEWIIKKDIQLRNAPILEKYITFSQNTKPENLLTEMYIPI